MKWSGSTGVGDIRHQMGFMTPTDWTFSPADLGPFDCSVVRCIAGEFDEDFLELVTKSAGVDVRQRMARLVQKHFHLTVDQLNAVGPARRRQMANDIVVAEIEERHTMPGPLAKMRTIGRD